MTDFLVFMLQVGATVAGYELALYLVRRLPFFRGAK